MTEAKIWKNTEENERKESKPQKMENQQGNTESKSKVVIQIPSYQEVLESSQQNSSQSLFKPSKSFSQAFSFLKSSEFYSPPPSSASSSQSTTDLNGAVPRHNEPSDVPSSAPASTSAVASSTQSRNAILVSHRQKGNPLLKHIRNARWAFADIVCDYLLGPSSCALYLSLRYHLLHPDYLYYRIRELQKNFKLRVVLCHVDVEDVVKPLLEITKTALLHDCTLLCAWSLEECGRYLETIKVYENKPADLIRGQMDTDYQSRLNHALTTVRHVNKTDVITLGSTFGSLSNIMDASMEDLARCPGIGERKVKRLHDTFHEPFKRAVSSHAVVPEIPVQKDADPSSPNEASEGVNSEEASKRKKKEPEVNIKSALHAAFSKYSDKIGKKNNKPRGQGEPSTVFESEAETKSSSEGAAS